MDETTDIEERYIVSKIIGTLLYDSSDEILLLNIEKANHSTISKAFDKSLFLLWPNRIQYDDVLLFVTDATPYMTKAARNLQSFYMKMVHLTFLACSLHRVAEEIRSQFENVDDLVAKVKKIFRKCHIEFKYLELKPLIYHYSSSCYYSLENMVNCCVVILHTFWYYKTHS